MSNVADGTEGGFVALEFATPILNFILLVGISPIFWLAVLGPTVFAVALRSLRLGAYDTKQDVRANDLHPALKVVTELRDGAPAYAVLNFSIQFFTLFASLVGLNLALWRMVLVRTVAAPPPGWELLHPHIMIIKGIVLTSLTLVSFFTGFFGTPKVILTYAADPNDKFNFLGVTFPPFNRITVCRFICAIIASYLVYLTYFGLGVRIVG